MRTAVLCVTQKSPGKTGKEVGPYKLQGNPDQRRGDDHGETGIDERVNNYGKTNPVKSQVGNKDEKEENT
ncbi:unnamed protein product [marine sediment metagenome]|uniref:Uncharacterized protein n=1 Tax=marine sediment metagenome TaxID=412755 RepID=X0WH48_9ZZZZ